MLWCGTAIKGKRTRRGSEQWELSRKMLPTGWTVCAGRIVSCVRYLIYCDTANWSPFSVQYANLRLLFPCNKDWVRIHASDSYITGIIHTHKLLRLPWLNLAKHVIHTQLIQKIPFYFSEEKCLDWPPWNLNDKSVNQ